MRQNRAGDDATATPRAAWLARQRDAATQPCDAKEPATWTTGTADRTDPRALPASRCSADREVPTASATRWRPTSASASASRPPPLPATPRAPPASPIQSQKAARSGFRNRQSIILIAIIIVALVAGGLAGAELYARHRADNILVGIAECVVQDGVAISYGVNPPFLWQHMTGHYTNISVSTAGNHVQEAKGMTADVTL